MKLRNLHLHPFAAHTNFAVELKNGLNIILGPNEAGKSTLLRALRCLLFETVELTPAKFRDKMQPYLPLSGGDTVRVSGDIDIGGETYKLEKTWGGSKQVRLVLPSGADFTKMEQVEERLAQMLGFNEATYKQALITFQNDLANTINELKNAGQNVSALAETLRQKAFDVGGVAVDELKLQTDKNVEEYFSNWDENRNMPRDGKDIYNRHIRRVGKILQAYYDWRELQEKIKEVEAFEQQLDALNLQHNKAVAELEVLQKYVQQFAPVVEDARKRQLLEADIKALETEKTVVAEMAASWPVQENNFNEAQAIIKQKQEELQKLQEQILQLRQYQRSVELRKQYENVKQLCDEFYAEQEALKQLPKVTQADVKAIREAERQLDKLKGAIEGQKLKIAIKTKKEISFSMRRGMGAAEEITVSPADLFQADAASRIQIDHEDFTIAVVSGEGDVKQVLKNIEIKQNELTEKLKAWNVEDIDALDRLRVQYEQKENELRLKKENITRHLNGQKLAELEEQVKSIKKPELHESLESLEAKRDIVQTEISNQQAKLRVAENRLQEWKRKYASYNAVFERSVEIQNLLQEKQKQVTALKPLPENITDAKAFLDEFIYRKSEFDKLQQEELNLSKQKIELERNQPDVTAEDLREALETAQRHFEKELRTGKAYKKVQQQLHAILDELDKDTFTPLKERTEFYFNKLTGGKYKNLFMSNLTPTGIQLNENGVELPAQLLSAGTLDLLALATRLAMADFYLQGKDGFLVLDDPLVNLDPQRQQLAAQCLREIAGEKQVIILTCHPKHAEILDGSVIEL